MFKYTKHNLKKLETLFQELNYTIRYEKGNFQSGYCIVENRKIAVINRFFDTEGRINCLLEIINELEVDAEAFSESSARVYREINKRSQPENEASEPSK